MNVKFPAHERESLWLPRGASSEQTAWVVAGQFSLALPK